MNWLGVVNDIQLICLTMIAINGVNMLVNDFSWLGFGGMMSGFALIVMMLIMKHTDWGEKK